MWDSFQDIFFIMAFLAYAILKKFLMETATAFWSQQS